MSNNAKRSGVNRTATRKGSAGGDPLDAELTVQEEDAASVEEGTAGTGSSPAVERAETDPETDVADKPQKELSERAKRRQAKKAMQMGNPSWFVPVMLGLFIVGLIWIVVFYLSQMAYPIPKIQYWNLAIGFGLIMLGFGMTTRWK